MTIRLTTTWLIATGLFLVLQTGCCAPGDPSCAVHRELYDTDCGRELLYCPDTSVEGLNRSDWYCDPIGWNPDCPPALECGPAPEAPVATAESTYALPRYTTPSRPAGR
ncbi:MAG: hypothetical protein NT069_31075 [Planctomycetota bacterium]|nr:hypothetical protein [Planctomycetota bacterium]